MSAAPLLRIDRIVKQFGSFTAVDSLSLDIGEGEFFALLGPSGCGKTTLLRMLAGFESPDSGAIYLNGEDIAQVPPHQRPVNMMFQNYALFPHLNVQSNIAFGLKRAGLGAPDIAARVTEMVALARLQGLEKRRPDQLSGGQRQRVALARALARRPKLLLLDEPLAALDKKLREVTQAELKDIQRRLCTTFIIVTHDQSEAMTVADRIGVMDKGSLVQVATPRQLYDAPNSKWVASFVGDINLIEGTLVNRDNGLVKIGTTAAGVIVASHAPQDASDAICIAIRPEKILLSHLGTVASTQDNTFNSELTEISFLGGSSVYTVKLASGAFLKVVTQNSTRTKTIEFVVSQRVAVSFSPDDVVVLKQ